MNVAFEKTLCPCIMDDVIAWHVVHGFVWDLRDPSGRLFGVFFATLLNGDGTVIHFSIVPGEDVSPALQLAAYRKGVRIVRPLGVVFATIPEEKSKLLRIARHLGFVETQGDFHRPGTGKIRLLKLIEEENAILDPSNNQRKEASCQEAK